MLPRWGPVALNKVRFGGVTECGLRWGEVAALRVQDVDLRRGRIEVSRAATSIGRSGLYPHQLRHTAASLSIPSGATVKSVQRILGHVSATLTMDRYGHLFADELDEVAARLDDAMRENDVDPMWSRAAPTLFDGHGDEA